MTTPGQRYQQDLTESGFEPDEAQRQAVVALEALYEQLLETPEPAGGLRGWWQRRRQDPTGIPGLYLWGGVGRGKTYLMDMFYECLPAAVGKRRAHFHRFMQSAHERLRVLRAQQDPLRRLAAEWAADTRVLCFDEFFVSDIADAMVLSGLLHGLVEEGVTLVATSNVPPESLYRDGLQRDRFLPAIDLLESHTRVLNVDGGVDYRLRLLSRAPVYHVPADEHAHRRLAETFEAICPEREHSEPMLTINQRRITARAVGDGVLWCDFDALCKGPRSPDDYVEIARQFHTVLLWRVPILDRDLEDAARRFIALVDEFYDRGVKLVIAADAEIDWLYRGARLRFEFRRTVSRLREMQSHEYLGLAHRP
ncbi:cell division protein ZapE [Spiribacter pallidus]|uniref:Cell division protein ZapE n=1 Tax=Spiribacter pallidus TaxID=1987936 RepID=A0ABV3TFQ7_9GAMM